jgi:DNA-directed RNA polymerase subunit RPC12/RpoP
MITAITGGVLRRKMIKFHCPNCKRKFGVPDNYAGRQVHCNKCGQTIIVPKPITEVTVGSAEPALVSIVEPNQPASVPITPGNTSVDPSKPGEIQLQPFQNFEQSSRPFEELRLAPQDESHEAGDTFEELQQTARQQALDTTGKLGKPRFTSPEIVLSPPWYWPFLFPLNGTGLGMIGMFIFCRFFFWLVIFVSVYMIPIVGLALAVIAAIISFIIRLYAYWYACLCVHMSAQGQTKAPDVLQHDEGGIWEMVKQILRVTAAISFCMLPAILYYRYYNRTDELFWGVLAAGWFFLPMTLLSTIMYDSLAGLNPFLIVISIIRVLFKYVLLVLELSIPFGLFGIASVYSKHFGVWFVLLSQAISLYAAFVGAAMLGRFFYRNEARLNWAV